jgi:hypothetical protein
MKLSFSMYFRLVPTLKSYDRGCQNAGGRLREQAELLFGSTLFVAAPERHALLQNLHYD